MAIYKKGNKVWNDPMLLQFVEDELDRIVKFAEQSSQMWIHIARPAIELSDEEKWCTFGTLSDAEVAEELRKIGRELEDTGIREKEQINRKIDEAIGRLRANEEYREENRDGEFNPYDRLEGIGEFSDEGKEILKRIAGVWGQRESCVPVLGEYVTNTNTIRLYYVVIAKSVSAGARTDYNDLLLYNMDFKYTLSMTLAHEYFHAIQYHWTPSRKLWRMNPPYITEAFADFFSYLWLKSLGFKAYAIADRRKEAWRKRYYTSWPYAKALEFITVRRDQFHIEEIGDDISARQRFWLMFSAMCGFFPTEAITTVPDHYVSEKIDPQFVDINKTYRMVWVVFPHSTQEYTYFCDDSAVSKGDQIQLVSASGAKPKTLKVTKVKRMKPKDLPEWGSRDYSRLVGE